MCLYGLGYLSECQRHENCHVCLAVFLFSGLVSTKSTSFYVTLGFMKKRKKNARKETQCHLSLYLTGSLRILSESTEKAENGESKGP